MIAPARRIISDGHLSQDSFGNVAFNERLQKIREEVNLHSFLNASLDEHLQKLSGGERSLSLFDAKVDKRLQGRGGAKSGFLPAKVLQATRAIRWLWVGSSSLLSVRNIYTAMKVYRERRSIDKDIAKAFTRSRIIAFQEAHKHHRDSEALVDIFSTDSLSALRTFVEVSARIAERCATGGGKSGDILKQHAENAQKVYDILHGEVCRGIAQEVESYTARANALAQEYWKSVPDPEAYGFQKTLYYEVARKRNKVYVVNPLDEYDTGKPRVDEIDLDDFKSDCQPHDLEQCSAAITRRGPPWKDTSELPNGVVREFEKITHQVELLLRGMQDEGCSSYRFDDCTRRVMLCTYRTRTMFQAFEATRELQQDVELQQVSAAAGENTRKDAAGGAGARDVGKRPRGSWLFRALKALADFGINKIGFVAWADLVGEIAVFLHRFRARISELLHNSEYVTSTLQMIYELFWTEDAMNVAMYNAQVFFDDLNEELSGIVLSNLQDWGIPIIAKWLQGFSWLAVKKANAVDVSKACDKAAGLLQSGDHVNMTEVEAMAMDSLQELG